MKRSVLAVATILVVATAVGCTSEPSSKPQTETSALAAEDWQTTSDEWMTLYNEFLTFIARSGGIADPPKVDLIRIVPFEDWADAQVLCLAEEGFTASALPGGALEFADVPVEQGSKLNLANYVCNAKYPFDVRRNELLPVKQATAQYEYLTASVAACVGELGYSVSDPPTLQTWLGDYYADGLAWDPITEAWESSGQSHEVLTELYAQCPREAPDLYPRIDGLQY